MGRIRQPALIALLALAFTGSVVGWMLWPRGGAESQGPIDPVTVQPVLQQLGPNTTLHFVQTRYRRYGDEAADVPVSEGPETKRVEGWMTFDDQGVVADYLTEARTLDGTLIGRASREGENLVQLSADGLEQGVSHLNENATAGRLRDRLAGLAMDNFARSSAESYTTDELDGRTVLVFEERRPVSGSGPPADAPGFHLPYIADLNPVEEIRRTYVLADEYRQVRSEVVIVSADGMETVVESREYEVFEVLSAE